MVKWIKDKWAAFEAWVASKAPGWKTHIITAAGFVASSAATMKEYIAGLPLDQYLTGKNILILNAVLFTLAFWLTGIGKRVEAREDN